MKQNDTSNSEDGQCWILGGPTVEGLWRNIDERCTDDVGPNVGASNFLDVIHPEKA
jgi:hypothetical protein